MHPAAAVHPAAMHPAAAAMHAAPAMARAPAASSADLNDHTVIQLSGRRSHAIHFDGLRLRRGET
jgi:hypothetical protein